MYFTKNSQNSHEGVIDIQCKVTGDTDERSSSSLIRERQREAAQAAAAAGGERGAVVFVGSGVVVIGGSGVFNNQIRDVATTAIVVTGDQTWLRVLKLIM